MTLHVAILREGRRFVVDAADDASAELFAEWMSMLGRLSPPTSDTEPTVNLGNLPAIAAQKGAVYQELLARVDQINQESQAAGFSHYTTGGEPQGMNWRVSVPPSVTFLPDEKERQAEAGLWNAELDALVSKVRDAVAAVRAVEEIIRAAGGT